MKYQFWTALATLGVLFAGALGAQAQALSEWGIVVLPGKAGASMSSVASALRAEGAKVSTPSMSYNSGYQTYDATLGEVGAAVAQLRAQGARRIAVVGQSLGANVALGYGARRGGVAAIVAMAPGHQPDRFAGQTAESLKRAKQMMANGRGSETASFTDVNQGRAYQISTTAAAYVSFFDPTGPAVIARNRGNLRGAKLLWIVGSDDNGARSVARGGKLIVVPGGHAAPMRVGGGEVVKWLKSL
jgi:pimeloyl-ACP methyl ester carboxylesterase